MRLKNKQNTKPYTRIICATLAMVLVATCVCGCGKKGKSGNTKVVDKFLKAAKEMDYEKAGKYATDETMDNLGWNDMDVESLENVFYSSLGVEDEDIETLKADSDVDAAVEELVTAMQKEILDYSIQKKTYEKKGDTATVKVTVTRISPDQLSTIFEDVQSEIEEEAKKIGEELKSDDEEEADLSDEEKDIEVLKRLIPTIVPSMIDKLENAEGAEEEWTIEVDTTQNKVSGVYDSEK